jgi:CRAL/TRIO domain
MDITKFDLKTYSIEEYIRACIFFVEFTIENALARGKVENWNDIIDMGGRGLRNIPLNGLRSLANTIQSLYKCRLAHCIILNPPSTIYYIWTLAKYFVDPVIQSKVVIESSSTSELLNKIYDPCQLEAKFGGTAPNATKFWPPIFPKVPKLVKTQSKSFEEVKWNYSRLDLNVIDKHLESRIKNFEINQYTPITSSQEPLIPQQKLLKSFESNQNEFHIKEDPGKPGEDYFSNIEVQEFIENNVYNKNLRQYLQESQSDYCNINDLDKDPPKPEKDLPDQEVGAVQIITEFNPERNIGCGCYDSACLIF